MGWEYWVLFKFRLVFKIIFQFIVYCEDEVIIGVFFYLMEWVEGIILRGNLVKQL